MADGVRGFYGRWAGVYDRLANAPGVDGWRDAAVSSLALDSGDAVVDLGCGTGATLPHLRERVGPEGTVVGVDLTGALLARAGERAGEWANVHVLQGDATRLPLTGPADAVVATFVSGMVADPAAVVESWASLLAPGGRLALLDGATSTRRIARPLVPAFRAFVRAGAPPGSRGGESPASVLDRRVAAAHDAVDATCEGTVQREFALGFVRLTAGRVG